MITAGRLRQWSLLLGLLLGGGLLSLVSGARRSAAADADKAPVLLELFTSEGCSSCPSADRLLMRMVRDGQLGGVPVIGLEWHVDYWNYIGWADPFSAAKYSGRQEEYARAMSSERSYTPQMVIDGAGETLGSSEARMTTLVNQASQLAKARISLERHDNTLAIAISGPPALTDGRAELWLALTERELVTAVLRGENAGQKLAHGPVVRSLRKLAKVDRSPFSINTDLAIERGWKREHMYAVAFVQRGGLHQVIGAAELPLDR